MKNNSKVYRFKSCNGIDNIYTRVFLPKGKSRGYIQIVHDIYEHIDCYEEVMEYFANAGYICFGHDHIGHGNTANSVFDLGKIKTERGLNDLIGDVNRAFLTVFNCHPPNEIESYKTVIKKGERLFPKKETVSLTKPPIHAIVGIGFGSSLAKLYPIFFDDVNCIISVGDCGFPIFGKKKLLLCKKEIKKYGEKADASTLMQKLEKNYDSLFDSKKRFCWRSTDRRLMNIYYDDPLNNFEYDLGSVKVILETEYALSFGRWCESYPLFLATYVVGGEMDPTNNCSKEISSMVSHMQHAGLKNVFHKIYSGGHNLFFETCRKELMADISLIIGAVENQQYANIDVKGGKEEC